MNVHPPIALAAIGMLVACAPATGAVPDTPPTTTGASPGASLVGSPAPDFSLPTLDGKTIRLSDYAGRPVLVNFWASWCQPCREEMPEIVKAYRAHRDAGLEVLAVDLRQADILEDVRAFVDEFDMTFPVLLDDTGAALEAYDIPGLPSSVFIDARGIVRGIHIGPLTADQLAGRLAEILP